MEDIWEAGVVSRGSTDKRSVCQDGRCSITQNTTIKKVMDFLASFSFLARAYS